MPVQRFSVRIKEKKAHDSTWKSEDWYDDDDAAFLK